MTSEQTEGRHEVTRFLIDQEDAHSANAIACVHSVLAQIGMPRSPQKTRVWERENGGASLRLLAGTVLVDRKKRVPQPLPQGPYARLILADISTYALRHKTTLIPMEASAGAYMRDRLHLFPGGGKRGTYTSFKREAQALAACHMELGVAYGSRVANAYGGPIAAFEAWNVDDGPQQALWPCELELSVPFLRSLMHHGAPVDMRAYRALAHSALAQDIYSWLAHRLHRLPSPVSLPWAVLAEQFGGYSSAKLFRQEFIKRLKEVCTVYPDAKVEIVNGSRKDRRGGYLLLRQSRPPVLRKGVVLPASLGAPATMGDKIPQRPAALPPGCPDD